MKMVRSRKTNWLILFVGLLILSAASFILLALYQKDDRVKHVLRWESYAATEDFARQFCQDVEKAVRYANLRQKLETDGELNLYAEIAEVELSDQVIEGITLSAAIDYGQELGLYFDEENRLVTRRTGSRESEAEILETTEAVAEPEIFGDEAEKQAAEAKGSEEIVIRDAAEEDTKEGNILQEYYYYPTAEEMSLLRDEQAQERIVLLEYLYALAEYYDLQKYLCVAEGQTNFAYRFVYADADREICVDQNLENPGNSEDVIGLGSYFRLDSNGEDLNYNFHDSVVRDIYYAMANGGLLDGGTYELAAGVNIEFPCHDQYFNGLKSYRSLQFGVFGVLLALLLSALLCLYATLRLLLTCGEVRGALDRWYTEPAVVVSAGVFALLFWSIWVAAGRVEIRVDMLLGICFFTGILYYLGAVLVLCSLVRRYQQHQFFSRSLTVLFFRELRGFFREAMKNGYRLLWGLAAYFCANILGGLFLGRAFQECFVYSAASLGWRIIFFLSLLGVVLSNGIFLVYLIRHIRSGERITEALTRIAGGDVEAELPEEGFHGQELVQVQAINAIGEGLAKAVAEQTRSERMKTDLIANVSHDLRTPLTSIINYVDLIRREHPENPKIQNYLDVLEKKSLRLKHLTEDLLDASKVSSGNMPVNWMRIDLVQMVSQMEGEFQEKLDAAGLTPVTRSVDPPLYIQADGRLLFRVLENLFNNVCKYSMPGTRVYIDIKETSHKAVFTMKNISAAPLNISAEELTERFVRGDSSRTTEGTGLGLSIAQSITELLRGQFEIYLEGDLFRVRLIFPLDESDTSSI